MSSCTRESLATPQQRAHDHEFAHVPVHVVSATSAKMRGHTRGGDPSPAPSRDLSVARDMADEFAEASIVDVDMQAGSAAAGDTQSPLLTSAASPRLAHMQALIAGAPLSDSGVGLAFCRDVLRCVYGARCRTHTTSTRARGHSRMRTPRHCILLARSPHHGSSCSRSTRPRPPTLRPRPPRTLRRPLR